jgi:hypothetical protein
MSGIAGNAKLRMAATGLTDLPANYVGIVPDWRGNTKMLIAISTGRVSYRVVGCDSGQPRNRGTFADFLPVRFSDLGQCVHGQPPAEDGKRLRQQEPCIVNRTNPARPKIAGKFVCLFADPS